MDIDRIQTYGALFFQNGCFVLNGIVQHLRNLGGIRGGVFGGISYLSTRLHGSKLSHQVVEKLFVNGILGAGHLSLVSLGGTMGDLIGPFLVIQMRLDGQCNVITRLPKSMQQGKDGEPRLGSRTVLNEPLKERQ